MAKSIKDLDSKVNDLKLHFSDELGKFRNEISKIKSPINEEVNSADTILNEFNLFKATILNRLQLLESEINLLKKEAEATQQKSDNSVQHSNQNKIILFGLKEKPGESLVSEMSNIFSDKLNVNVKTADIYNAYRVSKKNDNKTRPVIVEFCTVWKRNEVFYTKRHLKGSPLVIAEVLSPLRNHVFKLAKKKLGKRCWTNGGRIGFKVGDTVKYVVSVDQFDSAFRSVAEGDPAIDARS